MRLKLLVVCFLCIASVMSQAQYVVQFTGGVAHNYNGTNQPYALTNGDYGSEFSDGIRGCDGDVTTTFHYQTTDGKDAPPNVILDRSCVASTSTVSATGFVAPPDPDNGFHDPVVTLTTIYFGYYFETKESGNTLGQNGSLTRIHHYETVSVDSTAPDITRTISPVAPPVDPSVSNGTEVIVDSLIHTVRISLDISGGLQSPWSGPHLLIGQQTQGTLTYDDNTQLLGTSCIWVIAGGKPFSNYDPNRSSQQYTPWTNPGTGATSPLYFAQPGEVTILCIANLNSVHGGSSVPVETSLRVDQPKWSTQVGKFSDFHLHSHGPTQPLNYDGTYDPFEYMFYTIDVPIDPAGRPAGCFIDAAVATPAGYILSNGQGTQDFGSFSWVQIVVLPNTKETDPTGTVHPFEGDGLTGLDASFPYQNPGTGDPPTGWLKANGSALRHLDTPGYDGLGNFVKLLFTSEYDTYLFYLAPGSLSRPVPLTEFIWIVNGVASYKATDSPPWTQGRDQTTSPSSAPAKVTSDYPDHPTWSYIHPG